MSGGVGAFADEYALVVGVCRCMILLGRCISSLPATSGVRAGPGAVDEARLSERAIVGGGIGVFELDVRVVPEG